MMPTSPIHYHTTPVFHAIIDDGFFFFFFVHRPIFFINAFFHYFSPVDTSVFHHAVDGLMRSRGDACAASMRDRSFMFRRARG